MSAPKIRPFVFSCACFVLLSLFVGCDSAPTPQAPIRSPAEQRQIAAIERVLLADQQTSSQVQHSSGVIPYMRGIDLTDCPVEFKAAFLAHIHAWEEAIAVLQEAEEFASQTNQNQIFWESFVRGFFGDVVTVPNQVLQQNQDLQSRYEKAHQEVGTTYRRVEEIAVAYGATLPPPITPPASPTTPPAD